MHAVKRNLSGLTREESYDRKYNASENGCTARENSTVMMVVGSNCNSICDSILWGIIPVM